MDPIPDRQTFIRTVRHVIYDDLYVKLKHKNTEFYAIIESCVRLMYKEGMHEGQEAWLSIKKDWTLDDIMEINTKLLKLSVYGAGITRDEKDSVEFLIQYMREYIYSQKIHTSDKSKPREYTETSEVDFIKNTIDYIGQLYNLTDKRTPFSKAIRRCIEIFWTYNVTWQRLSQTTTLADIQKVKQILDTIPADPAVETGQQLNKIIGYIDLNMTKFSERTPDLQERIAALEKQVQDLQLLVKDLLLERPPPLTRQVLLQQLARCT